MKKLSESKEPPLAVAELAKLLQCPFQGDGSVIIKGIAGLENAGHGDLVYVSSKKFMPLLEKTEASAAIIPADEKFSRIPIMKSENPVFSFIKASEFLFKPYRPEKGIHSRALVSLSASIGKNVSIGAFSFVGDDVEIGDDTVIFPHVSIYPKVKIGKQCTIHSHVSLRESIQIGNRVTLHNGVVIGSDGFGYIQDKDKTHLKIPQTGSVMIGDDVEIGANTTVDRSALEKTMIKKGTKIDNLVQIAHNVKIGQNCIIAGQVGIAGSSKVGNNVILAGQVGIVDHVEIANDVIIAAKSGIRKNIPEKSIVSGSPHLDIKEWRKAWVAIPRLYDLFREVRKLKKRIEELENR